MAAKGFIAALGGDDFFFAAMPAVCFPFGTPFGDGTFFALAPRPFASGALLGGGDAFLLTGATFRDTATGAGLLLASDEEEEGLRELSGSVLLGGAFGAAAAAAGATVAAVLAALPASAAFKASRVVPPR